MPSLRSPSISWTRLDRIHHDAVADDADLVLAQDAGGNEVQDVFLALDVDGVAGVVAALRADHHVRLLGQHVNDLAFAFVAPLGADQNRIRHIVRTRWAFRRKWSAAQETAHNKNPRT